MTAFHYTGERLEKPISYPAPFRLNDGGRQHSKRPRRRNDCTVRAIAIVCALSYDSAYELLKANGRKCSRVSASRPLFEGALLNEHRFKPNRLHKESHLNGAKIREILVILATKWR